MVMLVYRRVQYHTVSLCSLYNPFGLESFWRWNRETKSDNFQHHSSPGIPRAMSSNGTSTLAASPPPSESIRRYDFVQSVTSFRSISRVVVFLLWKIWNIMEIWLRSLWLFMIILCFLLATHFFLSRLSRLAHWWYSKLLRHMDCMCIMCISWGVLDDLTWWIPSGHNFQIQYSRGLTLW